MSRAATRRGWLPLFVLSLVGLLVGGWAAAQYRFTLGITPLLVRPSGLAVDADGFLYVGAARDRIHRYAPGGELSHAWNVESESGPFRLRWIEGEGLEVATERNGLRLLYGPEGERLSRAEDAEAFARLGPGGERRAAAQDGSVVELRRGAVVRLRGDDESVWVPRMPWPMRWFAAWPWSLVALLGLSPVGLIAAPVLAISRRRAAETGD